MRRYTILYRLTLCLAFLLSASCSRKDTRPLPEELTCAERLMWQAPDSALHVLQSMPVPPESQRLAHATWALLTAQAKYRLGLSQTDSLIHIACDYFHRHGDARQKAYTYNYMASISKELQRQEEAQRFYHLAAEEVERTDDNRLGYLIYSGLADLYAYQSMSKEALRMANKAEVYAWECNDSAYISSAELLKARAYMVLGNLNASTSCYRKALRLANQLVTQSNLSNELAEIYRRNNMPDSALYYMQQMIAINKACGWEENSAQNIIIAQIYSSLNNVNATIDYAMKVLADSCTNLFQTASAHQQLYLAYKQQKDYQKAAIHCFEFCQSMDSIHQINQSQALAQIQAQYDQQKIINEKNRLEIWIMRGLVGGLIMIGAIVSIYRWHIRRKNRYIHELEEEIAVKMTRLQDNDRQIQILQCAINQMNENETETIKKMREKIEELEQTNQTLEKEIAEKKRIKSKKSEKVSDSNALENPYEKRVKHLREQYWFIAQWQIQRAPALNDLISQPARYIKEDEWAEIVKAVNEVFNHYINRLTDICPISQTDIELCCLIKLRCTNKQIAEMLAIDPTSVSKRKVRLRSTLEKHVGLGEGKFALEHWLWDF